MQVFALGGLLRLGLSKTDQYAYHMVAVSVAAAAAQLQEALQRKGTAELQCYQQEYGGSLLAVLRDPACSPFVRVEAAGGQQHALLLIDRVVQPAAAAALAAASVPLPIPLQPRQTEQAQQGANAATSADALAAGRAALQLRGGSAAPAATGAAATSAALPAAQLVTTAAAAEAAVAELLAVPEVAVDCEGDLERDGAIALVQLYGGGERCWVLDLAGMEAGEVPAAVGHLARLLESDSVTKVGVAAHMLLLSRGWMRSLGMAQRRSVPGHMGRLLASQQAAALQPLSLGTAPGPGRPPQVMHDCRSDCEALFYQHGIRPAALWDTQASCRIAGNGSRRCGTSRGRLHMSRPAADTQACAGTRHCLLLSPPPPCLPCWRRC